MRNLLLYVAVLVVLTLTAIVAGALSRSIARRKNVPIPGIAGLSAAFLLSALLGFVAGWLCGLMITDLNMTFLERFIAAALTWFVITIAVTFVIATSFAKSDPGKVRIIALPWVVCFTVVFLALSVPVGRSLAGFDARMTCVSNLKQLYMGLAAYAADNYDKPPVGIEGEDFAIYIARAKVLRCPAAKKNESYGYDPSSWSKPSAMILWDGSASHQGGRNVLYGDGIVEWLSEEEYSAKAGPKKD
jgi:prepilin-type processing-associated H-X9-DG protein